MFWACPNFRGCGAKLRLCDETKIYAYARKRLKHQPRECYPHRIARRRKAAM
jgi:hypothetical protein